MLSKLEKNKWLVELLRSTVSAVVVTIVAGVFTYAAIINRLSALEKANPPNRLEFNILSAETKADIEKNSEKFKEYVPRYEMDALQKTLGRIETNVATLSESMIKVEKDVAVITATYEKKTSKPAAPYDILD